MVECVAASMRSGGSWAWHCETTSWRRSPPPVSGLRSSTFPASSSVPAGHLPHPSHADSPPAADLLPPSCGHAHPGNSSGLRWPPSTRGCSHSLGVASAACVSAWLRPSVTTSCNRPSAKDREASRSRRRERHALRQSRQSRSRSWCGPRCCASQRRGARPWGLLWRGGSAGGRDMPWGAATPPAAVAGGGPGDQRVGQ
jgi:hypothetical protein